MEPVEIEPLTRARVDEAAATLSRAFYDSPLFGYVFPKGLEEWANFDYVGGRGPWISADQWRNVERFKFYTRHAWKPGAWRWPLRTASQWRCEHDWYGLPVEKLIVDFVRPPQQVS